MYDVWSLHGLGRSARIVFETGELDIPSILFLDGYGPYEEGDVLLDTGKAEKMNKMVLWEGNPLMGVSNSGDGHLFSIPAHVPYPPSIDQKKDVKFLESEIFSNPDEPRLYVFLNATDLEQNPRSFTENLAAVLEEARPQDILYAPGLGEPSQLAVLAYLGVNLFDSQKAVKASLMGKRLVIGSPGSIEDEDFSQEQLRQNNYSLLRTELRTIKEAIKRGELRNLAEERAGSNAQMMSVLRIFDDRYYDLLERDLPVGGKGIFKCVSRESLNRPAVIRWRKRLQERYVKPQDASVLLLLPCSARKPYSFSKSHKLFRRALDGVKGMANVHEVIVTSPLGLVPRELELFHPANSYDIPVTGVWDNNEKEMIRGALRSFLERNSYEKCVVHFPEMDIVAPVLKDSFSDTVFTCQDGKPTSEESLKKLRIGLEKVLEKGSGSMDARKREDMINRMAFQFTNDFVKKLPDFKVKGRYPGLKVVANNEQLGMYVIRKGAISLTLGGAKFLAEAGIYTVEIDDFVPKGTVFAVGVLDATDDIRPGDEVVLVHGGEVKGSGIALMSGRQMKLMGRGGAVAVRHYIKTSV
jgi:archaeosine synthase